MLYLDPAVHELMLAHALGGFPDEACGLMGGRVEPGTDPDGRPIATVTSFVPARNVDASSRTYAIGLDGFREAEETFDRLGLVTVGVMHSHTHSEAWPSPTDVDRADNPFLLDWHYVIVSLRDASPALRSFLLDGRQIREETVVLVAR